MRNTGLRVYYFAYGSNMASTRLRERVPSAELVTTGYLLKHRLCFHKVGMDGSAKCDAFYTGGDRDLVLGAIYRIDPSDKDSLDRTEGLGKGYEEKQVSLFSAAGAEMKAFTYVATAMNETLQPFHWYKGHVLIGAREHRFPEEYVTRFLSVESVDDPDRERAEREMSLHGLGSGDPLRAS